MADQSVGSGERCSDESCSHEADILVIPGDGVEPATALREAAALRDVFESLAIALRQKGIDTRPGSMRVVEAPARRRTGARWRRRLGIGALAVLLLVASAVLPPSQIAEAEAQLGQPIAGGQTVTLPAGSGTVDFTVERAAPGQATTVPFTVVDGCGEWQTFVGGGPGADF